MQTRRRQLSLALLGLPLAGCAYRPLPDLPTEAAPTPAPAPAWRPLATGQRWTYRKYNGYNGELLATEEHEVTAIDPLVRIRQRNTTTAALQEEVQLAAGRLLQRDPAWDYVQNYEPALPLWPAELSPGARSGYRGGYRIDGQSYRYWITQHTRVLGWETVTVPQGRLRALRVEHFIKLDHPDFSRYETTRHDTLWLAPEIGRWVARETTGEYLKPSDPGAFRGLEAHHRWELVSWS
ncbi:MAG: hypothetical protein ACK4F4_06460 [Hylemonella sp.]|jgi:hypothetical protein|uniref:hypothetical protein n=1 Tax=Hylemonella sp. TaxID=2066020 RepID=UPI003918E32E